MAKSLNELLKAKAAPAAAPTPAPPQAAANPETEPDMLEIRGTVERCVRTLAERVVGIQVEAVIAGCLQRIELCAGTDPAQVRALILEADPNAQVRDAFPMRGMGGNRDTKSATAIVINVRVSDSGKFIDLTCQNGEALSVAVSKKKADQFPADLAALGKLHDASLAAIAHAFEAKASAVVILKDDEKFGVNYWKTDDGKAFLDSLTAEPPAPVAQESAA